jgi:hypothetical protein
MGKVGLLKFARRHRGLTIHDTAGRRYNCEPAAEVRLGIIVSVSPPRHNENAAGPATALAHAGEAAKFGRKASVVTQPEPGLFKKVTDLDVKDFELLVSLGLFSVTRIPAWNTPASTSTRARSTSAATIPWSAWPNISGYSRTWTEIRDTR